MDAKYEVAKGASRPENVYLFIMSNLFYDLDTSEETVQNCTTFNRITVDLRVIYKHVRKI